MGMDSQQLQTLSSPIIPPLSPSPDPTDSVVTNNSLLDSQNGPVEAQTSVSDQILGPKPPQSPHLGVLAGEEQVEQQKDPSFLNGGSSDPIADPEVGVLGEEAKEEQVNSAENGWGVSKDRVLAENSEAGAVIEAAPAVESFKDRSAGQEKGGLRSVNGVSESGKASAVGGEPGALNTAQSEVSKDEILTGDSRAKDETVEVPAVERSELESIETKVEESPAVETTERSIESKGEEIPAVKSSKLQPVEFRSGVKFENSHSELGQTSELGGELNPVEGKVGGNEIVHHDSVGTLQSELIEKPELGESELLPAELGVESSKRVDLNQREYSEIGVIFNNGSDQVTPVTEEARDPADTNHSVINNGSHEKPESEKPEANNGKLPSIVAVDSNYLISDDFQALSADTLQPKHAGTDACTYDLQTFSYIDKPFENVANKEVESQPIIVTEDSKLIDSNEEIVDSSGVATADVVHGDSSDFAPAISVQNISKDIVPDTDVNSTRDIYEVIEDKIKTDDALDDSSTSEEERGQGPTLGVSGTAEQIIREMMEQGSSSLQSGAESNREYAQKIEGQITIESDGDVDTDEEGDGKEPFDSAALTALLKAASSAGPDGSITITTPDAARLFSTERPAGLGPTLSSLRPTPHRPNQSSIFARSKLAVAGEQDDNMSDEEKRIQEKIQGIRVKFMRLVQRLGHSPEDAVASQVLYRLGLAEGIRRGRQTNRAFSLESAKNTAMQIEAAGTSDLDFSCNILILGKTGVGKSATINSIFGEEKTRISAFEPSTTTVKEIVGTVDGVNVRVIDTPGLRPSIMDQSSNRKILLSIKKFTKKCPPDIILYIDRVDTQTRDFNDLPLLKSISTTLGPSIWLNAIVALTHAASAPPDGPNGSPLSYEVFVAQRSHIVQHSIRQAAGDMRLMNPVALVENHPSCRRNREGQRVLPNGQNWRPQLLLLCYSSKILSEANSLLKLQDPSPAKLFGFRVRSPPLPYLLSSLLQHRAHPKLSTDMGGDNVDSDVDLDELSDSDNDEEDEYDQLPPFKPLKKSQIDKLSKEQRKAYFEEYDYRVKLFQRKQWKEELQRLKESRKRGKQGQNGFGYGEVGGEDFDQENGSPAAVPVPMPDMALPPSFDGDYPAYRYRFLEPTSQLLARPVLDTHGWDHDCGYDGVSLEESLAIANRFPAAVSVQVTKDKREFNIHLDSSIAAKHGDSSSTLAGFDVQSVGKQLAYIVKGETKFRNFKRNKTAAGVAVIFLGENVATGLKVEDSISIGKRLCLVASTGVVRSQGDMAYGLNLETLLKDKEHPISQDQSTLSLSLMKWRSDLALGANLQSQFSVGHNSKVAVRVGLNSKQTGQITVRTSSSEQLQIALVGFVPIVMALYRIIWPGESYFSH